MTEEAVIDKLGIVEKCMPGKNDGSQEMSAKAALRAVKSWNRSKRNRFNFRYY